MIFVHPWVLFFQKKYKIERAQSTASVSDSQEEESSGSESDEVSDLEEL
jgi:hypothetical protein